MNKSASRENAEIKSVLIAMTMAILAIVMMVVWGTDNAAYFTKVSDFVSDNPGPGEILRLDGSVRSIQILGDERKVLFCTGDTCISAVVPMSLTTDFHESDDLILTGTWHDNALWVTKILKRCH